LGNLREEEWAGAGPGSQQHGQRRRGQLEGLAPSVLRKTIEQLIWDFINELIICTYVSKHSQMAEQKTFISIHHISASEPLLIKAAVAV